MKKLTLFSLLFIVLSFGCKKEKESDTTSKSKVNNTTETPKDVVKTKPAVKKVVAPKTKTVAFKTLFGGMLHLAVSAPGESAPSGTAKVKKIYKISDEKGLKSLISSVPKNFISKGPSKPNTDPILKDPKVDFTKVSLIVVQYDYMWTAPKIVSITPNGKTLVVKAKFAEKPPIVQHANGVGSYTAVSIPKTDLTPILEK